MKIAAGQLRDRSLDYAIAHVVGVQIRIEDGKLIAAKTGQPWSPRRSWNQMGPVLDKYDVDLSKPKPTDPVVHHIGEGPYQARLKSAVARGEDYREAIGRALVLYAIGGGVDVPDEIAK